MNGYIKLHRKMMDWCWYSDNNTRSVFIHILLLAAYKPKKYRDMDLMPGQTVISVRSLAEDIGLSVRNVRTALKNLQTTHELTIKTTHRYTVVTVENWGLYQCADVQSDTVNDTVSDNQTTQSQEKKEKKQKKEKNNNNIKNNNSARAHARHGDGVSINADTQSSKKFKRPTVDDVKAYCAKKEYDIDAELFVDFYESKDWMVGKNKMKDWQAAVRNWERRNRNASKSAANKTQERNTHDFIQRQDTGREEATAGADADYSGAGSGFRVAT